MSKYAAAVGTVTTGTASGAGGGGGGCGGLGGSPPPGLSTRAREARGFVVFLIFTEPAPGGGGGGPEEPPVYCTTSMGESAGGIM